MTLHRKETWNILMPIDKNIVINENTVLKGNDEFPVVLEKKLKPYQF